MSDKLNASFFWRTEARTTARFFTAGTYQQGLVVPLGTFCRFSLSHLLFELKLRPSSADSILEENFPSGPAGAPLHLWLGGMLHGHNCPGILAGLLPVRSH